MTSRFPWYEADGIVQEEILPGDLPFRLYLITDRRLVHGDLAEAADRILRAVPRGSIAIQLREKDLPAGRMLDLARQLGSVCSSHGTPLLVNDRVDVALAAGADGVHLPASSFPPGEIARRFPHLLIGVSTHGAGEAGRALDGGAHFVTLGPVYRTPSKEGLGPPLGQGPLLEAIARWGRRVVALGGVGTEEARLLRRKGVERLACIRAVWSAGDPCAAALGMLGLGG